ncbi:type IV secretion system protein [Brucella pituitosa]|uniref:type IV secretion system protein n=1 Tax=Brucella pituitosa TaxID=571256 RepID=UPI0009A2452B|nr:type IV secretion system protein [Brucella pituitosa]
MADGLVTSYVASATAMLGKANEAGFSSVANAINSVAIAAGTFAFILAIFNQFFQIHYVSPAKILALMIKLILLSYFGMRWSNFSIIAASVESGMNSIADSLLHTITSGIDTSPSLAGSIDAILSRMAMAANKALAHTGWVAGAFLEILVVTCLALLGAASALIIIYSKIMISLFIMIAPLFICCLIFERTSDYFYRWLQGAITYALYPVITAVVMALIAAITDSYMRVVQNSVMSTIAEFIPFITVIVIAIIVILFIPVIVAGLSGMIQHVSPLAIASPLKSFIPKSQRRP